MEEATSPRQALLAGFALIQPDDLALISRAIAQQAGESQGEAIANLGKVARRYSSAFGASRGEDFVEDTAHAQQVLQDIFSISKTIQRARGDLTRSEVDEESFAKVGDFPKTVLGLMRNLRDFGVYVDETHHCIGVHIKPHKTDKAPNPGLQQAIANLAMAGKMVCDQRDYYDACANERSHLAPSPGMGR